MNDITKSPLPVIAGVEINTDSEGRFNLNALHKASGAEKRHGPGYWMALESTKELIRVLEQNLSDTEISVSVVNIIKGGINQGTFAHEILAVEYAGWISAVFRIQVNQTFIDHRTGKPTARQIPEQSNTGLPEYRLARALKMSVDIASDLLILLPNLSEESRQCVMAKIINPIARQEIIPLPVIEHYYTAEEVGIEVGGLSANMVGRIANTNKLKTEENGKYFLDKSRHSSKQVEAFRYNSAGVEAIRQIVQKEHPPTSTKH